MCPPAVPHPQPRRQQMYGEPWHPISNTGCFNFVSYEWWKWAQAAATLQPPRAHRSRRQGNFRIRLRPRGLLTIIYDPQPTRLPRMAALSHERLFAGNVIPPHPGRIRSAVKFSGGAVENRTPGQGYDQLYTMSTVPLPVTIPTKTSPTLRRALHLNDNLTMISRAQIGPPPPSYRKSAGSPLFRQHDRGIQRDAIPIHALLTYYTPPRTIITRQRRLSLPSTDASRVPATQDPAMVWSPRL